MDGARAAVVDVAGEGAAFGFIPESSPISTGEAVGEERDLRDERPKLRGATPPSARAGSGEEVGEGMGMDLPAGAHMAATRKTFACARVRARSSPVGPSRQRAAKGGCLGRAGLRVNGPTVRKTAQAQVCSFFFFSVFYFFSFEFYLKFIISHKIQI
jgi:hypothetical protein